MRRGRLLRRAGSLRRSHLRRRKRVNPLGRRGRKRQERMRHAWEELRARHPDGVPCAFDGCRRLADDLHHRLPRSRGGGESEVNLVPMCRTHHRWIEEHPEAARREGWTIPTAKVGR